MRRLKAIAALPLLTLAVACEPDTPSLTGPDMVVVGPSTRRSGAEDDDEVASTRRSGALHLTKECSAYTGLAGEFCTITSSNLKQIKVGSRIIYLAAAVGTSLDSDVVLDPPGRGNSTAFGHCIADFVTGQALCTFSGGTGKFRRFQARLAVSPLGWPNFALDGTYSFGGKGGKGDDDHED